MVLTLAERIDFVRAYYRAMTLVTLMGPLPSQMLLSWSTLDFKQVKDVMMWLGLYCSEEIQRDMGVWLDYQVSGQNIAGIISGEKWKSVYSSLIELGFDLQEITADVETDTLAPYFPFLVRDRYQDQYKSNRGARLADLLPLVRERNARRSVGYELSEE